MTGERNWSLDLIRALAVVEVLAVHFFSNIQYYEEPLAGTAMVAAAFLRPALMTCVPLFLLLSGYLCVGQTWSRDYYWRLGRVVSVYLLASAACLLFKAVAMEGSWNPLIWCREILNFNGAPYSWYIEMYLGLFLLIPFINAAWRGVDRAGRLALTASLMCMAILPSAANLSRYTDAQVQLVPGWWEKLYPPGLLLPGSLAAGTSDPPSGTGPAGAGCALPGSRRGTSPLAGGWRSIRIPGYHLLEWAADRRCRCAGILCFGAVEAPLPRMAAAECDGLVPAVFDGLSGILDPGSGDWSAVGAARTGHWETAAVGPGGGAGKFAGVRGSGLVHSMAGAADPVGPWADSNAVRPGEQQAAGSRKMRK